MLTLTENATAIIGTIVQQTGDTESGLRIQQDAEQAEELAVGIAEAPQPGDTVLEAAGARVFLDETANVALDDKVLDAQTDEEGRVAFGIGEQAASS